MMFDMTCESKHKCFNLRKDPQEDGWYDPTRLSSFRRMDGMVLQGCPHLCMQQIFSKCLQSARHMLGTDLALLVNTQINIRLQNMIHVM